MSFVRKTSGLVREFEVIDGFIYNVMSIGPAMAALTYAMGAAFFPGADINLGILFAGFWGIFQALAYALLNASMPRSAGDYVFQSRILHPALGYMSAWQTMICWIIVFLGAFAMYTYNFIVFAPFLGYLGYILNNSWLSGVGVWLTTTTGEVAGGAVYILYAGITMILGMRFFAKWQRIFFVIGMIGFVIVCGLFASTNVEAFRQSFNSYMTQYTPQADAYSYIIDTAKSAGFNAQAPFSLYGTIGIMPIAWWNLAWASYSSQQLGEIRGAASLKNQIIMTIGSEVFCVAMMMTTGYLLIHAVGYDFLGSIGYLFYFASSQNPLPIPPYYGLFADIISNNLPLVLIIGISFIAWQWQIAINCVVGTSRNFFALSMDNVLPKKFSDVSTKYRTPVFAIVVNMILAFIVLVGYVYTNLYTMLFAYIWGYQTCFLLSLIAGLIFPFRKKTKMLYEASPAAKYKVGGIPLVSIASLIAIIGTFVMFCYFVAVPTFGFMDPLGLGVVTVFIVSGFVLFYAFKYYRKGQGIDISLNYSELPPE